VSVEAGRENAYRAFCFTAFPCAAREINLVRCLISGASCVGSWTKGSRSKKKSDEEKWYLGLRAEQRSEI
jgi:hypothetical protein